MKVYFSVNDYDKDGDPYDKNIRLHFGQIAIKIGTTMKDFDDLVEQLKNMRLELEQTYRENI